MLTFRNRNITTITRQKVFIIKGILISEGHGKIIKVNKEPEEIAPVNKIEYVFTMTYLSFILIKFIEGVPHRSIFENRREYVAVPPTQTINMNDINKGTSLKK